MQWGTLWIALPEGPLEAVTRAVCEPRSLICSQKRLEMSHQILLCYCYETCFVLAILTLTLFHR